LTGIRAGDGVAVEREHLVQASVEEQRLLGADQERVEGEAGRLGDLRHVGRQAINPVGDFGDLGLHGSLRWRGLDARVFS
jgi:hypothetical protein